MFRVDVNQILNFQSNSNRARARNPNPFRTRIEPDNFESDEFRMFSFKVKDCPVSRAHEWTICPYAHSGERARRRDPRRHSYVAVTCPDFRATGGLCPRAEHCPFAHGVFEYWLHPTKYRTRACNSGRACTRPVCFFAHSPEELRSEPAQQLPKWAKLVLLGEPEAQAREQLITGGKGSSSGIKAQTLARPGPKMSVGSSCGTSSSNNKMVQNELMEGLRRLGINKNYNNNINDKIVNMDYLETPNIDWVSDLLAN